MSAATNTIRKCYRAQGSPYLVKRVLDKRGWTAARRDDDWSLFWKNGRFKKDETSKIPTNPHYKFNHFPHTDMITQKGFLQYLLKSSVWKFGQIYKFFPTSFALTGYNQHIIRKYFDKGGRMWIGKPPASSRGRGITITRDLSDFSGMLQTSETNEKENEVTPLVSHPNSTFRPHHVREVMVVQEYIRNPHLVAGYKHDLRLYVVVTSLVPLRAYLYLDGLSRFCTEKYTNDDLSIKKHLTNTSIQTKLFRNEDNDFSQFTAEINEAVGQGDFAKRRMRSLFKYLNDSGIDHEALWNKIRNVLRMTLLPIAAESEKKIEGAFDHHFELLGFDLMITDDLEVKLIEVNLAPSLGVTSPIDYFLKKPLVDDLLDLVFPEDAKQIRDENSPLLRSLGGPDTEYLEKRRSGNYELLFPFNEESEDDAMQLRTDPEAFGRIMKSIETQHEEDSRKLRSAISVEE